MERCIEEDKKDIQCNGDPNLSLSVLIRRKHILEDAYDQLSKEQVNNIKPVVQVQMKNIHGLDETGEDEGGIFRLVFVHIPQLLFCFNGFVEGLM